MIRQTSFSICGTKPISRAVLMTLKPVWKAARANESRAGSTLSAVGSMPTMRQTALTNGKNTISTHTTPKTLNRRWAIAVRRACVFAFRAARLAVTVVPMFSPMTSAMPWKIVIAPVEQRTMVMAIRAAELCTSAVSRVPISRNRKIVR